ncbi:hypothetical protein [Serpentinicella alkaliphila]|uniref:HD domain-containing protein n=1 Tax=Serpentinicella alkaliphila TaxID=1734049 RepID=A0A4R2TF02_9FIRM|nr:hypothetical protein [Serpentinicella alkaliphila]TCQ01661.1 hypothetical protein EDD79_10242 [Serpentinicella alkaliphila]
MTKLIESFISIEAILHDIGAVEVLKKYGSLDAQYQEKEGEILAKKILSDLGYSPERTVRACYIVGNHHTSSKIDGLDFQIVWEADYLENLKSFKINEKIIKKISKLKMEKNLYISILIYSKKVHLY